MSYLCGLENLQRVARLGADRNIRFEVFAGSQRHSQLMRSARDAAAGAGRAVIVAREVRAGRSEQASWDAFAKHCGASVYSADAYLRASNLKSLGRSRLRRFEVVATEGGEQKKIAQCAISVGRSNKAVFVDKIALLPGHEDRWPSAMAAILQCCGPGNYVYGWTMNIEAPREDKLAALPGVSVETVTPLVVQAIDFAQWDSWDSFMRGIRKGARQSAQFARRDIPDLAFRSFWGRSGVTAIRTLMRLRLGLSSRKRLGLRTGNLLASYLGWMVFCPKLTVTRLAIGRGQPLAAYLGMEFGENTYYWEAASVPDNQGAQWALLLSSIKEASDRAPKGRFVMGYVNYAIHDDEVGGGLVRSRQAVRAVDFATSVVAFRYAG
jgi:hypothetical protein